MSDDRETLRNMVREIITELSSREIMDTRQAADYLNCSRQWLEIGRHKGYGPEFIKLGRSVKYRRETLDRFLADREQNHTS